MEELFQKVPKSHLPEEIKPEVGMGLVGRNQDGSEQQLRITEVQDEHIVIDANHPLAGHDLTFDLTLVEIK
jgi:FKBP-type peptidyl-prolyl cis-trans isomerase 2